MVTAKRILSLAISLAAMSSLASGYYHWIYFANRTGPFNPVPLRFDLNALPGGTVNYIISDQSPGPLVPGDSLTAIVSEIEAAANVWNGVTSSALRVQFGGIGPVGAPQSTPGIDVVFDDNMPPGILAQTKPTTVDDVSFVSNGAQFVPILRSRVQFRRDLADSNPPQASFYDWVFTTMVHEFGHALGLQHTMTSGVMSTIVTRATTKAAPLSPDDVAGISVLYPAGGFPANMGSITGQVTLAGRGVNLASVVALSASGVAVSGMTNPDGAYRIDGIPAGQYYVYVHPLPPAQQFQGEVTPANIVWPVDSAKNPFPANTGFGAVFFPGTTDWTQASLIGVMAGNTVYGVNFNVQARSGPTVYDMQTYAYQGAGGQVPVPSPPLQSGTRTTMVFYANGTVVNNNLPAPDLNISVIGGPAQVESGSLKYYTQGFLMMVVDANQVSAPTPVALAVTRNNDLYVLPAAFMVVPSGPPAISSLTPASDDKGNRAVAVAGSNLSVNTRILFDGAPTGLLRANQDGTLLVSPPAATGGYSSTVEALNGDGQSSSQALGSALPPLFTYDPAVPPSAILRAPSIAAGTDAMVEIDGVNTNFVDGETAVGFGSSDITLRRLWVTGPQSMLLNLSVSPQIPQGVAAITLISGLQTVPLTSALQISPPVPNQLTFRLPIVDQGTGLAGVPIGDPAVINVSGLPQSVNGWSLTIGGARAAFSPGAPGQIVAKVPNGVAPGPALVQLISPAGVSVPPVLMQVDPTPPFIAAATDAAGAPIEASHPARPGNAVRLTVAGLSDQSSQALLAGVQIHVGGVAHMASSVTPSHNPPGSYSVQFLLGAGVPSGSQTPVTVAVGTRVSAAYPLATKSF
jgi:uncharacterized protein (TIGR03437 family)